MDCKWCKDTGFIEGAIWDRWECLECKPKADDLSGWGFVSDRSLCEVRTPTGRLFAFVPTCRSMEDIRELCRLALAAVPALATLGISDHISGDECRQIKEICADWERRAPG